MAKIQVHVARVQVLVTNIEFFTQNLKKVLNFLAAKSGYQKPKLGSLSKFQVAYGLPGYC